MRSVGYVLLTICLVQAVLLWTAAERLSPNPDEFAHLVAGITYWKTGVADVYNVNPPLVRLVASLPLVVEGVRTPSQQIRQSRSERIEFSLAQNFVNETLDSAFGKLVSARRACIPIVVVGTVGIFLLGSLLISRIAGCLAAAIWALNPITLGYGVFVGCDIASGSIGAWAILSLLIAFQSPKWTNYAIAGICLGLAILTKSTWIIGLALWPLWITSEWLRSTYVHNCVPAENEELNGFGTSLKCLVTRLSIVLAFAWLILVAGYRGNGLFESLGNYSFVSKLLRGDDQQLSGNRFRGTWLEAIPIPFPRSLIEGMDQQWEDFDKPRLAFFGGEWKRGGWIWYYCAAMFVKLPLGWILLLIASLATSIRNSKLIAVGVVLPTFFLVLISTKTNMNEHTRYMWIVLPMLSVLASAVANSKRYTVRIFVLLCSSWVVGAGLITYPFGMSYSNECFGGPKNTSKMLAGSNVDWSHGWIEAKKWIEGTSYDRNRIAIVEPEWYPLSYVGILANNEISKTFRQADDALEQTKIIVLISVEDRMRLQRTHKGDWSSKRKLLTLAYCIEVYQVNIEDRGDFSSRLQWYHANQKD
jgi:hypothetical protein